MNINEVYKWQPNAYLPSNGTEGMNFEGEWCHRCAHDDGDKKVCEILFNAMMHHQPCYHKDLGKQIWEWVCIKQPTCLKFMSRGDGERKRRPRPYNPNQITLPFVDGLPVEEKEILEERL